MKTKLKIFLVCIVSGTIVLTVMFFFFLKCYLFTKVTSNTPDIKDITSNTLSFFSALATISAGLIAAYLFNDWKDSFFYERFLKECINLNSVLTEISKMIDHLYYDFDFTRDLDIKDTALFNSKREEYLEIQNTIRTKHDEMLSTIDEMNYALGINILRTDQPIVKINKYVSKMKIANKKVNESLLEFDGNLPQSILSDKKLMSEYSFYYDDYPLPQGEWVDNKKRIEHRSEIDKLILQQHNIINCYLSKHINISKNLEELGLKISNTKLIKPS